MIDNVWDAVLIMQEHSTLLRLQSGMHDHESSVGFVGLLD